MQGIIPLRRYGPGARCAELIDPTGSRGEPRVRADLSLEKPTAPAAPAFDVEGSDPLAAPSREERKPPKSPDLQEYRPIPIGLALPPLAVTG